MDSLNRPNTPADPTPAAEIPLTFGAWLRTNGPGLILAVAVLVAAYNFLGREGLWNAGKVALGLGFVVFIHELGHFAVAKWCDVYVETFSIGFGPALPGCSFVRGETTYKVALFPLGGYVKMLGEGDGDGEEEEDNPRSYKNKTVGQRMAIISAGVVMNLISACIFFVWVYLAYGERRIYGIVGGIEPGTPAWEAGIPSEARFLRIGDVEYPFFDDFKRLAMLSRAGELLPVVYAAADAPRDKVEVALEARRDKHSSEPMIGMLSGNDLKLFEKRRRIPTPVLPGTAAAKATVPFELGDVILGMTDPDPQKQREVTPLRGESDSITEAHIRQREFRRRLELLSREDVTFLVRRAEPSGSEAEARITVGPDYHHTLGLRMRMGEIAAVRLNSPASEQNVLRADPQNNQDGDKIEQVEVTDDDGKILRFVSKLAEKPEEGVKQRELEPIRLPWELKQWGLRTLGKGERHVHLKLLRKTERGQEHVNVKLRWDEARQLDREDPHQLHSPLSIPALGLAYHVVTAVEAVQPGSPAADKIKAGDVIRELRYQAQDPRTGEQVWGKWQTLQSNQWASAGVNIATSGCEYTKIALRVKRGSEDVPEIELTSVPDETWFKAERGLLLEPPYLMQHADGSFFKALELGVNKTTRSIITIYLSLRAMLTGRISPKQIGGPIMIAQVAYDFAGQGFYEFLMFLALISVNLAVINFLPIPLLDGGHMVMLTYEKLRGKPASDRVQYWAMVAGIAVIATIFLFASYQDIRRSFF